MEAVKDNCAKTMAMRRKKSEILESYLRTRELRDHEDEMSREEKDSERCGEESGRGRRIHKVWVGGRRRLL